MQLAVSREREAMLTSSHRCEPMNLKEASGFSAITWGPPSPLVSYMIFFLAALGLCCDTRTFLTVACGLSCSPACGILVPQPGIKPPSPVLEDRFLTTGPPGKSLCYTFKLLFLFFFSLLKLLTPPASLLSANDSASHITENNELTRTE